MNRNDVIFFILKHDFRMKPEIGIVLKLKSKENVISNVCSHFQKDLRIHF